MPFTLFLLYNLIRVPLFELFKIAGFFNAKIRKTFSGRRALFEKLAVAVENIPPSAMRIWMHISSMGEFEQGAPLVDELLKRYPRGWIFISLFSPSAYEHLNYQKQRTVLTYLPFDSLRNANRFIELIQPSVHVVIRHDIWPNYQYVLRRRGIPSILVDASISDKRLKASTRFRRLYKHVYATFSAICAVSEMNKERLLPIYPFASKIVVCGDTRYDRVYKRAIDTKKIDFLLDSGFFVREKCFIAGSSWPADEKIILPALSKALLRFETFSVILAPHEINDKHLEYLEKQFSQMDMPVVRLSAFKAAKGGCRMLLIDSFGLLANLYALGAMAYIGGGFGVGVHSVLEPAAHGTVVSYGPGYLNSPEAKQMTAEAIGEPVASAEEFERFLFEMLQYPERLVKRGQKTKDFVMRNVGASQRTADVLSKFLNHHE